MGSDDPTTTSSSLFFSSHFGAGGMEMITPLASTVWVIILEGEVDVVHCAVQSTEELDVLEITRLRVSGVVLSTGELSRVEYISG